MSINYFPFHIGDFLSGTMHMDGTEIGAYTMLIIAHYQIGEEGLPDDDKALARIAKLTMKQWLRVKRVVMEKFELKDSKWRSSKCVEVISQINSKSSDQRAKALKRWEGDGATALPKQSQPKANNQKPKISSNEDIPAWISKEDWDDFEDMRKKIKKPMTARAKTLIFQELENLRNKGHPPDKVLQQSIRKNWQDVYAIKGEQNESYRGSGGKPNQKSVDEHLADAIADIQREFEGGSTGAGGNSADYQPLLEDHGPVRA